MLGEDHPNTINTENNYALVLRRLQRYAEAEILLREGIARRARVYGENSRELGEGWQNLAAVLFDRGEYTETIAASRQSLSILDAALPPGHYLRAFPMLTIAGAQLARGQPHAARETLHEARLILEAALPADSLPRTVARARDAMALAALGECQLALPLLESASDELGERHRVRYAVELDRAFAHCPRTVSP